MKYRVTLIFESTTVVPNNEFFQEQWEQTAAASEGDMIRVENVEEIS